MNLLKILWEKLPQLTLNLWQKVYTFKQFVTKMEGPITMAKEKFFSIKKIPKCYKNEITSTTIWHNLAKLINYSYEGDDNKFFKSYKFALEANLGATDDQSYQSSENICHQFRGYKNRVMTPKAATHIISVLGLPEDALFLPDIEKEVAYVFVKCMPHYTGKLYEILTEFGEKNDILDECSVLAGDSDLFLRLYGTREQIRFFLTEEISCQEQIPIQRTTTHFSFPDDVWQKHPIIDHVNRKANRPYWLPENWIPPE